MLDRIRCNIEAGEYKLRGLEISLSRLALICGMNGAGKSFIMKMAWFASYMMQNYKVIMQMGLPDAEDKFGDLVSTYFGYTFHEKENINGTVTIFDKEENILSFSLTFKEGVLERFNLDITDPDKFNKEEIRNVQYNSKDARTFEQYDKYLKFLKILNIPRVRTDVDLEKITDMFRLYDVLWFENIRQQILLYKEHGLPEHYQETFARMAGDDGQNQNREFDSLVFKEDMMYFIKADQPERSAVSLSSGIQSMLMIILFAGGGALVGQEPEVENA